MIKKVNLRRILTVVGIGLANKTKKKEKEILKEAVSK